MNKRQINERIATMLGGPKCFRNYENKTEELIAVDGVVLNKLYGTDRYKSKLRYPFGPTIIDRDAFALIRYFKINICWDGDIVEASTPSGRWVECKTLTAAVCNAVIRGV